MNAVEHYDWTLAAIMEAGYPPETAHLIGLFDRTVDAAQAGELANFAIHGHPLPAVTQSYDWQWWRSSQHWDTFARIWTLYHFGGREALLYSLACQQGDGLFDLNAAITDMRSLHAQHKFIPLRLCARLGLRLHLWQDTYSHQGFRGWRDERNRAKRGPLAAFCPAIGHAEFGEQPDEFWRVWRGPGNVEINNRWRYWRMAVDLWALLTGEVCDVTNGAAKSATDWACVGKDGAMRQPECCRMFLEAKDDDDLRARCADLVLRKSGRPLPKYERPGPLTDTWRAFCAVAHEV
jgi:hypothetical protein